MQLRCAQRLPQVREPHQGEALGRDVEDVLARGAVVVVVVERRRHGDGLTRTYTDLHGKHGNTECPRNTESVCLL